MVYAIGPLAPKDHADRVVDLLGTNKTMDEFRQTRNTWNSNTA